MASCRSVVHPDRSSYTPMLGEVSQPDRFGAGRRGLAAVFGVLLGGAIVAAAFMGFGRAEAAPNAGDSVLGLAEAVEWRPHNVDTYGDAVACVGGRLRNGVELRFFTTGSPCGSHCCERAAPRTPEAGGGEVRANEIAAAETQTGEQAGEQSHSAQAPTPAPTPAPPPERRGSFIAIGDWGYDQQTHGWNIQPGCESVIAKTMQEWMKKLGDVEFVINVGDSFYPSGVSSKWDPQWESKWRSVFPKETRDAPWYSVYGNHDYQRDPCICTDDISQCAQVNADEHNRDFFFMPNYTYYKGLPHMDLEIIAMDSNQFMEGWNHSITREEHTFSDCGWTSCRDSCLNRAERRTTASFDLFYDRMAKSTALNFIVFSHYPTDYYAGGAPEFLDALRTSTRNITYFGGHRHSVDQWSTESIAPNTNWLVGGGGGWSCDSSSQGFVVGQVMWDYSVKTFPVLVDSPSCCKS